MHSPLSWRFGENDQALRYLRLPHNLFGDTLIAGTTSKRGNKYSEVFANNFGWTHSFSMKSKSEVHEAFSLMFHKYGVPPRMIFEGSKEQVEGDFSRECK